MKRTYEIMLYFYCLIREEKHSLFSSQNIHLDSNIHLVF